MVVSGTSIDSISLSWAAILYSTGPGGYEIEYSLSPDGLYIHYETTAGKTIDNKVIEGLAPNTTHYIRLRTRSDSHEFNRNAVVSEYTTPVAASTLTPAEAIYDLLTDVAALGRPRGLESSLGSQLRSALSLLQRGHDRPAMNRLGAFVNYVNAQRGKKLTSEQALALTNKVARIMGAI